MTPDTTDSALTRGRGDHEQHDDHPDDPRQLVLPHVDTALDVGGGRLPFKISPADAALALPAVGAYCASLWAFLHGDVAMGAGLGGLGTVAGFGAMAGSFASSWALYPHERVLDGVNHLRRRRSLPWGHADAVDHAEDLHGVEHVVTVDLGGDTHTGVVTHDGRAVVPLRLRGENTEFLRAGELATLSGSLTQGLDAEITPDGDPIAFYSTTRPASSRAAREYRDRADDPDADLDGYEAALLGRVGEWVADRDLETGANDTRHYLIVSATEGAERDRGDALRRRLRQAQAAVQTSDHLDAEALTPRETVNLAAEYWERSAYPPTDAGDSAVDAAVPPVAVDDVPEDPAGMGTTDAERALAPEWFAEQTRHVEVGDAVARTFWVSNWPEQPPAKFLHGLYTMSGVDLDVTLYGHPKPRENVVARLKRQIPRIDAEGLERAESMDVESLTLDDDLSAYVLAFKLLQNVNTQPWGLSGYITVRAPDEERLQRAVERVEKELKSPPAQVTPAAPFGDQLAAFRSCSPFGADHYAGKGDRRGRATKTHTALGGVFGAALPAATGEYSDPGGIRWGRDVATGETVQVDPFEQGTAPHMITVGPSGSGKTFSVGQGSQEWYLNGDDRTVIYCDTQGGFEDVVEAFGAEHIVIDGQTGINPLDIRAAPDHDRRATEDDVNQYRLKVDEATEFFKGILRSHGVDPADYHAIIEQAVERTYADAGITTDPATHGKDSPTPVDLFETLEDMMENPTDYTFTSSGVEADHVEEHVAGLLNELSGFKEGGKYRNILTDTTGGLSPDTDTAYLDMRQLAGQTGGTKSVNLQLAVGQVTQLIKQTEGETIFVIDEAHNLLHSPEMVDWLNKAAREWRRYDAALWFVTQSTQEFVRAARDSGVENKRETIVEQCSTIQIMNAPLVQAETLAGFNLPERHADTVQNDLVPGSAGKGYSECVLSFRDGRGWVRTHVEAAPEHAESLTFSHRESASYVDRMADALASLGDENTEGAR